MLLRRHKQEVKEDGKTEQGDTKGQKTEKKPKKSEKEK